MHYDSSFLVQYNFVLKAIRKGDLSTRTGNGMSFVVDVIEPDIHTYIQTGRQTRDLVLSLLTYVLKSKNSQGKRISDFNKFKISRKCNKLTKKMNIKILNTSGVNFAICQIM